MNRLLEKICRLSLYVLIMLSFVSISTNAALVNIEGNSYFTQSKIPSGKTGRIMNVTFTFTADKDYDKAWLGIAYDDQINSSSDRENPDATAFPFELTDETIERKNIGKINRGQSRSVTITARVRKDVPDGYYGVQVYAADSKDGGSHGPQEYINVWVSKATEKDPTDAEVVKNARFTLGEGQATPYGEYPNVMNFGINLKNNGKASAFDVSAEIVLDKDHKVFPFNINDVSYDRHFDKIETGATHSLDYSFSIRPEAYSGFYPIKMKISYRESMDGPILTQEDEFYVRIKNKEEKTEETAPKEFNPNDRTRARIIVDSFYTIPEKIVAGEEFELVISMKNASDKIAASNILFSFESEKVSESPIFSTVSGANSIVVNSLAAGASTEIRMMMSSKAAADPRSYAITIKEKYDSPDFKNAEESVVVNVELNQVARVGIGSISIVPEIVSVGSDTNVTFPINNTGKVTLYNVTAKLEASYINPVDVYLGNIKTGESKTADMMVSAIDIGSEEEKVKIILSYEDENGEVSTVEKDMDLTVEMPVEPNIDDIGDMDMPPEPKPWYQNIFLWLGIIGVAILGTGGFVAYKKFKAGKDEDDI